jgi:hypothetical protein
MMILAIKYFSNAPFTVLSQSLAQHYAEFSFCPSSERYEMWGEYAEK